MAEQDFLNYASGDAENVSVPRKFRAGKNSTEVELAYITPKEAGILATLRPGSPHRGPMEVPSYDDFDASGDYRSGAAMSAAESRGPQNERMRADLRAAGISPQEAAGIRSGAAAASGMGQRGSGNFFSNLGGGVRNIFGGIGDKFSAWAGKMRGGINPLTNEYYTQDEYEQNRYNRQIGNRIDRLRKTRDTGKYANDPEGWAASDLSERLTGFENQLGIKPEGIESEFISEAEYNAQPEFNFNTGPQIKRVGGLYGDHEIPDDIQNYLENQAAQNWMDSVQSGQGKSPHLSIEQIGEIADDAPMGFYQGDQSSLKDYQRGLVQNVGMNQDQIDYLNKVNQMNKNVDNTGEGAFYTYETPQNVMKEIESLNPESDKFFGGIDPDKIVVGDKSTYAQPQEVYDYINKLQPSDSYRYGKGTIGIATGGRVGYKTGGRVGILAAF